MNWYSCDGEDRECNQPRVIEEDKMTDKWTILLPYQSENNDACFVQDQHIEFGFKQWHRLLFQWHSLCYMTYAMSLKQQSTGKYVPFIY